MTPEGKKTAQESYQELRREISALKIMVNSVRPDERLIRHHLRLVDTAVKAFGTWKHYFTARGLKNIEDSVNQVTASAFEAVKRMNLMIVTLGDALGDDIEPVASVKGNLVLKLQVETGQRST